MSPEDVYKIKHSARQWKRTMAKGMSGSYTKALTELILNSIPSYQRLLCIIEWKNDVYKVHTLPSPQDSVYGIALKKGENISIEDLTSLKAEFEKSRFLLHIDGGPLGNSHPEFIVDVLLNRSRTDGGLAVKDNAEGLDKEDLKNLFLSYGDEKESHSVATRSIFGRGALDVLAAPGKKKPGIIESIKNKVKTTALFSWPKNEDSPEMKILNTEKAIGKNQTIVKFHPENGNPRVDSIIERLTSFYLLRNVNRDPNITLRVAEVDKNWNPKKHIS